LRVSPVNYLSIADKLMILHDIVCVELLLKLLNSFPYPPLASSEL